MKNPCIQIVGEKSSTWIQKIEIKHWNFLKH
jgi:hypothetical protein